MITFKEPELEWEFDNQLHPATRALVIEFARFLKRVGYAPIVITQVWRSKSLMAEYYGKDWHDRGKWSWHLVGRAVDMRNREWTKGERFAIKSWLEKNWPGIEVLMHDIGRGDHLHIAIPAPRSRMRRLKRYLIRRKQKVS